jgi:hypothetical protein
MPSWLHDHRSEYNAEENVIRVDKGKIFVAGEDSDLEIISNDESFELDLSSFKWLKVN